jgi:hypothetical protein
MHRTQIYELDRVQPWDGFAGRADRSFRQTVNGQVVGAEVADLNGNGLPEIYVYVQSAGSGSYGEVVGYAVIKGSELSPITLPELTGDIPGRSL